MATSALTNVLIMSLRFGNAGTGVSANTSDRVYPVIASEIVGLVKGLILTVKMESTANCMPI